MKQSIDEIMNGFLNAHVATENINPNYIPLPYHEAKQQLRTLVDEMIGEVIGEDEPINGLQHPDIEEFHYNRNNLRKSQRTKKSEILDRVFGNE